MSTTVTKSIASINNLVNTMKNLPQMEAPVKHHFSDGVYVREIFMPKDMVIVGKIHKTKHLNIVSQGSCLVVTPTRKFKVNAPCTFESLPGEQKVLYMLEDVVWSTVHVTDSKDLEEIEEQCIAEDYTPEMLDTLVESLGGALCHGV